MSNKAFQVDFLLAGVEGAELGTATFYAAGTTTLKTIWLDRNKATPAANPYTLDANGRAQLYADGIYKIVIKNAAGTTLHTYDNVSFGLSDGPWVDVAEYASLTAAVTAIGATETDLLIDSATTCTANTVIPATLRLVVTKKGRINQGSYTLTFNNQPDFPVDSQVFTGTGTVTGLKLSRPEWFGAAGDGATDDYTAVYNALHAFGNTGIPSQGSGRVLLTNGKFYATTQQIVIPDGVIVESEGGMYNTGFKAVSGFPTVGTVAQRSLVKLGAVVGTQYWSHGAQLRRITVYANEIAQTCVYSNSINESTGVNDCVLRYPTKFGVVFDSTTSGGTDPRMMHFRLSEAHVLYGGTAAEAGAIGILIDKTGSISTWGGRIVDCTVSAVNQVSNISAGLQISGPSSIRVSNFHAEMVDTVVRLGTNSIATSGVTVDTVDGYTGAVNVVEINNDASAGNILLNINRVAAGVITIDDKAASRQINKLRVPLYITGNETTAAARGYFWMDDAGIKSTRIDSDAFVQTTAYLGTLITDVNDPASQSYPAGQTVLMTLNVPTNKKLLQPFYAKLPAAQGNCQGFVTITYNNGATTTVNNSTGAAVTYGLEGLFAAISAASGNGRYVTKVEVGIDNVSGSPETHDMGQVSAACWAF